MKLTAKRRELIAAVQDYAKKNYDVSGWSVIVECYDEQEIAEVIGRARTLKGALAKFATIVSVVGDRIAEANFQIREAVGEPAPSIPASDGRVTHHHYGNGYGYFVTTWPGKVGREVETEDGCYYEPGWKGVFINSAGYCGHEGGDSPWMCAYADCKHESCANPPF